MLQQDLHVHTTYSSNDSAIVAEQTIGLVAAVKHAGIVGISDHFKDHFKFVISSDAHQPNWLGQTVAHYAAEQLGIQEYLVF